MYSASGRCASKLRNRTRSDLGLGCASTSSECTRRAMAGQDDVGYEGRPLLPSERAGGFRM
jgi:hypothetical protein